MLPIDEPQRLRPRQSLELHQWHSRDQVCFERSKNAERCWMESAGCDHETGGLLGGRQPVPVIQQFSVVQIAYKLSKGISEVGIIEQILLYLVSA